MDVIAPGKTPRGGGSVKTDRKDAELLARCLMAGSVTPVKVPSMRIGAAPSTWTQEHRRWLAGQQFPEPVSELAYADLMAAVEGLTSRKAALAERISRLALEEDFWPTVARLRCFRGVDTLTALTLHLELSGDSERFHKPTRLAPLDKHALHIRAGGADTDVTACPYTGNGRPAATRLGRKWLALTAMSRDDSEYLERIRALAFDDVSWTPGTIEEVRDLLSPWNHNIRLADGIYTAFCAVWYREHQAIMNAVDCHLSSSYQGKRVLDIGCLEGYFSLECALHGADVLGIDVKEINIKKCEFVKSVLGARNLSFGLDDAMNVTRERYGTFDVVLALGLLYHLDDPFTFLTHAAELCEGFLLLDTLVSLEEGSQMFVDWKPDLSAPRDFTFSGNSYRGRLYREYQEGADDVERGLSVTASHTNDMSVWLTEEALVTLLCDVGFEQVEKMVFPRESGLWWSDPKNARVLYLAHSRRPFSSSIFVPSGSQPLE